MNTSATSTCNKTIAVKTIPDTEFTYICARNQHQAHNLLMKQIKRSGYTQKQISQMTGFDEATISRLLRRPRNMELNTISKILYSVCGAALGMTASFPKERSNWVFQAYSNFKAASTAHPKTERHTSDSKERRLESSIIQTLNSAEGKVMELGNA